VARDEVQIHLADLADHVALTPPRLSLYRYSHGGEHAMSFLTRVIAIVSSTHTTASRFGRPPRILSLLTSARCCVFPLGLTW
jgi:hypothetical protein